MQVDGRHCNRFREGCPNCPKCWVLIKTPPSLSQALSRGPKCPSSSPPLCHGRQREREVNRGLLADDLEPIDCQSQQIAIVPLDSGLGAPLHSTPAKQFCNNYLLSRRPAPRFTILQSRITKSLLPEHQQHLEAVYDDGQPEFGFMNRQKYYLKWDKHPAEPIQ